MSSEVCVLVTFYSEPREAFLTSVFRVLEVFKCGFVEVFVSRSREVEARDVVGLLSGLFSDVVFDVCPLFPDPNDLNSFDGLVEKIWSILKSFRDRGRIVIAVFTGSRLEISTVVLAASRIREDIVLVYIPFYWGPWNKLFYPFTPKPLEPLTILHPNAENVKSLIKSTSIYLIDRKSIEYFLEKIGIASKFRRELAYTQYRFNQGFTPSTLLHPIDVICKEMKISISVSGIPKLLVKTNSYCNYEEVIDIVDKIGVEATKIFSSNNDIDKTINLLLKFSSILLPAVEECTFNCNSYRDTILIDFISILSEEVLIDTNIVYTSLHTLLYENKENTVLPLCTYIELLKHKAHFTNPYEKIRSAIAEIALEELKTIKIDIDEKASHQPCEIGIALTNKIAVTSDKKAYEEIFKTLKTKAILIQPKPLKQIKFLKREETRKIAYAYYALTQLKTLTSIKKIEKTLNEMKTSIEIGYS